MKHSVEEQARYDRFVAGLTALTREHGIALSTFGGVHMAGAVNHYDDLTYIADIGSGDLYPNWPDE
jgi:uncharacterized 2Fe-2S/4Fe-4S cluster protein (DUF4445 family)